MVYFWLYDGALMAVVMEMMVSGGEWGKGCLGWVGLGCLCLFA